MVEIRLVVLSVDVHNVFLSSAMRGLDKGRFVRYMPTISIILTALSFLAHLSTVTAIAV